MYTCPLVNACVLMCNCVFICVCVCVCALVLLCMQALPTFTAEHFVRVVNVRVLKYW
jgi:hypothetical protein